MEDAGEVPPGGGDVQPNFAVLRILASLFEVEYVVIFVCCMF